MTGAFGGNGEAIELTRQADCKVADVDHFLDFADSFGEDLARLQCDQLPQFFAMFAQHLTQQTDQFTTYGCRYLAPGLKCGMGIGDRALGLRCGVGFEGGDHLAVAW